MTIGLVDQICRDHLVTKKQLSSDSRAPLVVMAQDDFIKRAHRAGWGYPEIARTLKCDNASIQYKLRKFFGSDDAYVSPHVCAAEPAAAHPPISPMPRVVTAAIVSFMWSNPYAGGAKL